MVLSLTERVKGGGRTRTVFLVPFPFSEPIASRMGAQVILDRAVTLTR